MGSVLRRTRWSSHPSAHVSGVFQAVMSRGWGKASEAGTEGGRCRETHRPALGEKSHGLGEKAATCLGTPSCPFGDGHCFLILVHNFQLNLSKSGLM